MILSRLLLAIPDVLAAAVSADPSRCRRQAICPTAMRGLCTICEPLLVSLKLLWHYAHSKFFCSGTSPVRPVKCICRELIVVALCRLSYCDSAILGRSLLEAGSRRRDGCVASPGAPVITCREYCKRHLRLRVVCVSYAHFLCASRAARLPPPPSCIDDGVSETSLAEFVSIPGCELRNERELAILLAMLSHGSSAHN